MRAQDPVERGDKETASHGENSEASRHSETLSLESTPVSECGGGWGCQKVRRKLAKKAERGLGSRKSGQSKSWRPERVQGGMCGQCGSRGVGEAEHALCSVRGLRRV